MMLEVSSEIVIEALGVVQVGALDPLEVKYCPVVPTALKAKAEAVE